MHGKKIINNSLISITYKIVVLLLGFVTRKIFIMYLGEEILGLNSLYANLLDLLNLADLGIGVAVQYQLYEPLVKKDYDKLSKIITAARKIYNTIGLSILIAGTFLCFFIQFFIKSTTYPISYIRTAFFINVLGIALGYFFVHKRLFLNANEKIGLVNIIELITKLATVVISLLTTIVFKNYLLYLVINALHGLTSNLAINYIFNKRYNNIKANIKNVKLETKELIANLKDVIPIKLSNYVYNSTDNIVISKFLGLTTVALYSNYMTIINGIMGIEYLIGNVIMASFGKIIKETEDVIRVFKYFNIFQFVQYILTSVCMVGLFILCNPFIDLWIGNSFILEKISFILLIIDFYIHSMYQPANVMYGAAGKFRDDKYITLFSAIMNIVISLVLVNFIGLSGVIVGTLITDIYIWIVRSYQMVKKYFNENYIVYIIKNLKYLFITLLSLIIAMFICKFITIDNLLIELIIKGIICITSCVIINTIFTYKSEEFKDSKEYILNYFRRR